ncbi:glutamate-5-semialdehyde dehydrogenase [Ruminococcaceae bacterium OttesenSCG-928-I18]|nr:glutamate-5-semialdehyde dehydrogenase [Ruminococcaceae bacterium OttesenSCG-928-I18]
MKSVEEILQAARTAKYEFSRMVVDAQKASLEMMDVMLRKHKVEILEANGQDLTNAKGKIPDVMLDRLRLTSERIDEMASGLRAVANLDGPVPDIEKEYPLDNGLYIRKVRVPMGVIAIIYESRPNVTTDAAALCLRSGNVCVLRGGSEAINTNKVLVKIMRQALAKAGGPPDAVQLVEDTTHESARALMEARGYVDLLIPRGGKGLIKAVVEGARGVPVIETGSGICHIYVDAKANLEMADRILYNAKVQRPSVCNAAEVCLVHKDVAEEFLPLAAKHLKEAGVELRLDERAAKIIEGRAAGPEDFDTEFNDYILAIAVVDNLRQAIDHINDHSTGHSEAIISDDTSNAQEFALLVDSAAVYINASTRFTDGGQFGMGCEIGISTQKLGARGPMGLYELTSYKYVISGNGAIRE